MRSIAGWRARPYPDPDDRPRDDERDRVHEQRGADPEEGDDGPADREAQHLGELHGGERDGDAGDVAITHQNVPVERRPGGGERGTDQGQQKEKPNQGHVGHTRQRHRGDQRGAADIAPDHDLSAGQPVRQAGKCHPAECQGDQACRVGDRRQQW